MCSEVPIGIYEVERYPFLKRELAIIETAVKKDVPTIGICLGCQALAAVLAARVYPGREKELGWDEMALTKEGKASPLGAIDGVRVLNWHGDTFDLPAGATRLASTRITPNQAFAYGPRVLALQFHVELPSRDIEKWLIGHTMELASSKADLAKIRDETARFAAAANRAGMRLFNDWLDASPLIGVTPSLRQPSALPLAGEGCARLAEVQVRGDARRSSPVIARLGRPCAIAGISVGERIPGTGSRSTRSPDPLPQGEAERVARRRAEHSPQGGSATRAASASASRARPPPTGRGSPASPACRAP